MNAPVKPSANIIQKSIFLAAPRAKVWDFLTKPEFLARWFHSVDTDLGIKGADYTFTSARDGSRLCWGKVLDAKEPDYLKWEFEIGPMQGETTIVEWHFADAPGGTQLSLTHSGLPEHAEGFGLIMALDKGWHGFISNLQELPNVADDYSATIFVPATPEASRRAIFEGMEAWWSTKVEMREGGFTIRFNASHASFDFDTRGQLDKFTWTCSDANMIINGIEDITEWLNTKLHWHLISIDGGTLIRFTHEGLNVSLACQDVCTKGWEHFFETSLRDYLTAGTGSPETSTQSQ